MFCPRTTSVFSSLRVSGDMSGKVGVGLNSLSFLPKSFSPLPNHLHAIGYGYTTKKKDDAYAMLLTFRQASVPPILHWKTRLPEGHLSGGILVSPCGHYAIGGGDSGNIYIWNTLGGNLLHVVKAHYRPVQHMTWITNGPTYLATGGADGMVHVFDLSDLVDSASDTTPSPMRTWSQHHLPITGLVALSGHRLASASSDGKILLLHIPSQKVMATFQMPHKVSALTVDSQNTLYMGSIQGIISIIRLDEYAMHQLSQQHGMSVLRPEGSKNHNGRAVDKVFGEPSTEGASSSESQGIQYQSELKGHDRPVSSLTMFNGTDGKPYLCSGDESGCVRIWDLESYSCIQVTKPWSTGVGNNDKSLAHPISSIHVLTQTDEVATPGMLRQIADGAGTSSTTSKQLYKQQQTTSLVPLLSPLQKFRDTDSVGTVFLPVWNAAAPRSVTDVEASHDTLFARYHQRKKRENANKRQKTEDSEETVAASSESSRVVELERQLQEANEKIQRWEAVNNKLMLQLKQR